MRPRVKTVNLRPLHAMDPQYATYDGLNGTLCGCPAVRRGRQAGQASSAATYAAASRAAAAAPLSAAAHNALGLAAEARGAAAAAAACFRTALDLLDSEAATAGGTCAPIAH